MTVLFVDDEPQVLHGIERMLDAAEVEWDSTFAESGQAALQLLENGDIDTVVTDMRMPGMDGAEFLDEVSKTYPHIVRVVLSGQADKETVLRAVNPMHQYLSKPCNANELKTTIARACALRDVLQSESLQKVVGGISSLPSVPSIYQQLIKELESEDSSLEAIGEIIAQDPAMTAKILQIANSAVFGLQRSVTSPSLATSFLGIETIKALALTVGVFQQHDNLSNRDFSIESLMQHSLEVAVFSQKIINKEKPEDDSMKNDAFTAGMLHDIGKLVLISADSTSFAQAQEKANKDGLPIWQTEREFFGADHAAIGAYLLSIWGLPQSIIEVVAMHHRPSASNENEFSLLSAVAASNEICRVHANSAEPSRYGLLSQYLADIGCQEKISVWRDLCLNNRQQG